MGAGKEDSKERIGLTAGITVMFTPKEKQEIRSAAFHSGARSQSDFIRTAAIKAAKRSVPALKAAG